MASLNHNLCFTWTGDFDSLKLFVSEELQLNGVWEQPDGDTKILKTNHTSIVWRKSKSVLQIEGAEVSKITQLLCTKIGVKEHVDTNILSETNASSQPESVISSWGSCEVIIEDLKSRQNINRIAIQYISESVSCLTEIVTKIEENLAANQNNNDKGVGNFVPYDTNHENIQNNTIVIDDACASNDTGESQMIDQNNVDTDNIHLKNSAASTQDQKATSNKESEFLQSVIRLF